MHKIKAAAPHGPLFCCLEPMRASFVCMASIKEDTMNIEEQAQNDAMQNKNMMDDPNWSAAERQKYQAAYSSAKQKSQEQQ